MLLIVRESKRSIFSIHQYEPKQQKTWKDTPVDLADSGSSSRSVSSVGHVKADDLSEALEIYERYSNGLKVLKDVSFQSDTKQD